MIETFSIKRMQITDIDSVLETEHLCYPTPWSRFAFDTELNENHYALYIVGKIGGRVIAHAGTWVVLDEAHITNIAVRPEWQAHGIGGKMLLALLSLARARGAERATLEVRKSNHTAQKFYEKYGFVFRGRRLRYYTDSGEDALIMWKDSLEDIELISIVS